MRYLLLFVFVTFTLQTFSQNNVGVGTNSPTEKLDVIGNIKADTLKINEIQMPTGSGAGKVLTSDLDGNASWQTPSIVGGSGWQLSGNSGTNTNTNYIGTNDAVGLRFKIFGIHAGELSDTSLFNTSFGFRSLMNNTTGAYNLGFGSNSLFNNTSGQFNTGIGSFSMYHNFLGEKNVAIGANSLYKNNSSHNIGIGFASLYYDSAGARNIGIGTNTLFFGQSPTRNIAIGFTAGQFLNSADNVIIGDNAGQALATGSKNIIIGNNAEVLEKNMAGAIGFGAYSNQDSVISVGNPGHKIAISRMTADEKLHIAGNVKVDSLAGAGNRVVFTDAQGKLFDSVLSIGGGGSVTSITVGNGLNGGTITTTGIISMPNIGTPGTYGSGSQIPIITTDAQGRVTNISTSPLSASGGDNWGAQTAITTGAVQGDGTPGNPINLAQQSAATGQVLKWNGTAWMPASDNNTPADNWGTQTVQSNNTLSGNGTSGSPLQIAQQGAVNGQVLKWNGTTWVPSTDNSGTGSDNWGTQVAITDATLTGDGTASNPLKIAQQGAVNGRVLKWNGTSWMPQNDTWGTQTAQVTTTLTGNGTVANPLNIAQQGASIGQVLKWNGTSWVPQTDSVGSGSDNWGTQTAQVTARITGNGTIASPLDIAQQGATTGQVLKWNGTTWIPQNENADTWGTQVTQTNTTLSGNGTTGSPLQIAQQGAIVGQVLKWNGTAWIPQNDSSSFSWKLNGNSTATASSFVGTINNVDLQFKRNNTNAGFVKLNNTSLGNNAMSAITTGTGNVAIGQNALISNSSANNNTAVGLWAMQDNTTGMNNAAHGASALQTNISGSANTAIGAQALQFNTTGSSNSALGWGSLANNTTGNMNVGVGLSSLWNNTIGNYNVALGYTAGYSNTTGFDNTFIGRGADALSNNLVRSTAIGYNSFVGISNALVLGDTANAKVGIGTAYPTQKLDVRGGVRIVDGTQGVNKVLTSDANGNASWQIANSNSWGLTGNSGTNASANYIGTIDNVDFVFRRNNIFSGIVKTQNTAFGYNSYNQSSTGNFNTAFGTNSLTNNTTGSHNAALGHLALNQNTSGYNNVAVGNFALNENSTGGNNVALGNGALQYSDTGDFNIAIGAYALLNSKYGDRNIGIGYYSGRLDSIGTHNIFIGSNSGENTTTGSSNTIIGFTSGLSLVSGSNNTIIGRNADVISANLLQATAIGHNAKVGINYGVVLGDTTNAKVGIGTAYPTQKLHIKGIVRIEDGTQGANKVLTSDAAGNASWQTPASGSGGTLDAAYDFGGAGLGRTITADAGAVLVQGNDGLQVTGTHGSGTNLTLGGAGTKMFFYPKKSAFRAGNLSLGSSHWNIDSIGDYSIAMGFNTKAKGIGAFAGGNGAEAIGNYSTAFGYYGKANGLGSVSFGGQANGSYAVAFVDGVADAYGLAYGLYGTYAKGGLAFGNSDTATSNQNTSIALGDYCIANGNLGSTAIGYNSVATGDYSTAIGYFATATNNYAVSFGGTASGFWSFAGTEGIATGSNAVAMNGTANGSESFASSNNGIANGAYSSVLGNTNTSNGYAGTAIGLFNDTIIAAESSVSSSTPLFIVGNGSSSNTRSNALVVRKDANVSINHSSPNTNLDINGDIAYRQNALALINGANHNVNPGKFSFIRITGPTAAFNITGFTGGYDGKILTIYNSTTQNMTITNLGTLSTAANRINTLNGADIVTVGTGTVTLQYSSADSRWIVIATRD